MVESIDRPNDEVSGFTTLTRHGMLEQLIELPGKVMEEMFGLLYIDLEVSTKPLSSCISSNLISCI